jgi:hypothetical protein
MDPDPEPETDPEPKTDPKTIFKEVFCLLLLEGTFTSFFKDKKSKRSHKAVGIKVFRTIFAL